MASGKRKTSGEQENIPRSLKQNTKNLKPTSNGQDEQGTVESFLLALENTELCPRILSVMIASGLQDAMVEGVVFDEGGDYIDGQPLGFGQYVILGLGQIKTELKPGVHIIALKNKGGVLP